MITGNRLLAGSCQKGTVKMSQEKVDKYKELKAKRKELVEKERRKRKLGRAVAILILVLVIAGVGTGVGFTIRNQYLKAQAAKPDYSSTSLVIQDMSGLLNDMVEYTDGEEGSGTETEAAGETEAESSEAAESSQASESSSEQE